MDLSGTLFYGDNLEMLREHFPSESVDLIYLDPPFNSNATYNLLFKDESGRAASAQIEAFDDTWHWGEDSERALQELLGAASLSPKAGELLNALIDALGTNQMTAYLAMMSVRLVELHRVLKPTGSMYLHCDPTASHYLKLFLDAIFGVENYRNEIVWFYRRWAAAARRFQRMHDTIFFYSKSKDAVFNVQYVPTSDSRAAMKRGYNTNTYMQAGVRKRQIIVEDEAAFEATVERGEVDVDDYDRVVYRTQEGTPAFDVFEVPVLNPNAKERLSFPTQKPLALLEPIIRASSNAGDLLLDPFCGCGTAIVAAEKLGRRWAGIDVTHLAIGLVEDRLREIGTEAAVVGSPKDLPAARDLARRNPFQFETWAVTRLIGFRPNRQQTGDAGIDGRMRFERVAPERSKRSKGYGLVVAQVKAGRVGRPDVQQFKGALEQAGADMGVLIMLEAPRPRSTIEAAAAREGFVELSGEQFRRLQIWTIADYFAGREPKLPHPAGYEARRML